MNPTEGSTTSRSTSSTSTATHDLTKVVQGTTSIVDKMFPLYDQMMQKTKFPAWFLSLLAVFMLFQVLSIGFWIYAPPFQRTTGTWHNLYRIIIEVFTFMDPLNEEQTSLYYVYLSAAVAVFSVIWIILMIYYNHVKYAIPTFLLYLTSLIMDVIDPCFITPSVFVFCKGITGMVHKYESSHLVEVIVGVLSYIIFLVIYVSGMLLKSRSVILTNLTFPLFDSSPIIIWVIMTSFGCILSALMKLFSDWFYVILGVIHLFVTLYVCWRLTFIPFYEVWRNSICLSIGITTCALDINFFILYAIPSLTYNYTIFVFLSVLCIAYGFTTLYFVKKVARIKNELTYQEGVTSVPEYLNTLNLDSSSQKSMMYIVVGLARLGDYFIDGSLTDYIINNGTLENTFSILLQVVTFFPSESRKMDVLFKKLVMKRKLSYPDRFLLYQVYRIKTRRLVSDTKDTLETFNKLKQKNDECKAIIRGFWDQNSLDVGYLSSISMMINDLDAYFKCAISNNPNNLRITNEYADFLAECVTDFDKAIVQYVRAEYIGNGKNFNVDISFRSVVNKFPHYLKDKILDPKGRRVNRKTSAMDDRSQTNSDNSNSTGMSNLDSMSVDFEHQELVCKKMLRDAKVRLAFHHGISDSHPVQSTMIIFAATTLTISVIAIFVGFYFFFTNQIAWRATSYYDIRSAAYALFFTYYGEFFTLIGWAETAGRYNDSTALLGNITIDATTTKPAVSDSLSISGKLLYTSTFVGNSLKTLFNSFSELANQYNVYGIAPNLLREEATLQVCTGGKPTEELPATVKDQIEMMNFFLSQFAGDYNLNVSHPNLYMTNEFCQILANTFLLSETSAKTLKSILDFNIDTTKGYTKTYKIWAIAGSVALFVFCAVPALIIIQTYNKLVNKTIAMLLNLPTSVKEDCKKPLVIDGVRTDSVQTSSRAKPSHVMDNIAKLFFTCLFIDIAIFCIICWQAWTLNEDLSMMYNWYYFSCERVLAATQLGNNVINLIMLNGSLEQYTVSQQELEDRAYADLKLLIESNRKLTDGYGSTKKIIGYDAAMDGYQLEESCSLGRDPQTIHDMYACASIEQLITIFKNMVVDILKNPSKYNGAINDEVSGNVAHILQYHFYPKVISATVRMRDILADKYNAAMNLILILTILGLIVGCVMLSAPIMFRFFVNENYKLLLMCFKHINPQTIVDTPQIMAFFNRNKKKTAEEKMTISKGIVMDASECIIITNQNSIIEIINNSVTENLDITPDQMLGQHIANFVADKDQPRINQQIDLMMSGQGSAFWQDHIELVNEVSEPIPFAITMIGMKDREDSSDINSIVFILTNETEEIRKRKDAEEAKAKSEKLLYQILPKDIVIRLNRGETDISFTIKCATIFFVDIVKFSAYAASLTPTEIMTNLSLVFATFDKIVSQYESITKIKLIGDVYMAAAGLFQDSDDPSTKHAEDSVRCCLQIQKSMDEINMKLSAGLEVRIGVNSGGPLIGGVLGTDKPTFDIIGDPINVAARLQSTDLPGNVQISGATKEFIENLDFDIEERGEIYLKGKGNQLTYFVSLREKTEFEGSFALNIAESKN